MRFKAMLQVFFHNHGKVKTRSLLKYKGVFLYSERVASNKNIEKPGKINDDGRWAVIFATFKMRIVCTA